MAFTIQLTDAAFDYYIARAIPYVTDAEALFVFGIDAASSAVNRITGNSASYVGGGAAGTFADYHGTLNINYSLDSGIAYAGYDKTVVSVSQFQADDHSAFVAPQLEANSINMAFRARVRSSGYLGQSGDTISLNTPLFMAITSGGVSGDSTSYYGSAGTLMTDSASTSSADPGNIVFGPRGGRDFSESNGDETFHKHHIGLIYGRELSGAEMAQVYGWAAEYMSARGVPIV